MRSRSLPGSSSALLRCRSSCACLLRVLSPRQKLWGISTYASWCIPRSRLFGNWERRQCLTNHFCPGKGECRGKREHTPGAEALTYLEAKTSIRQALLSESKVRCSIDRAFSPLALMSCEPGAAPQAVIERAFGP